MAKFLKSINFNNSSKLATGVQSAEAKAAESEEGHPVILSTETTSESVTMKFGLTSGDTRSITVQNPRADLTDDDVKSAMETVIDHSDAFEDMPMKILSASGRVTTTKKYDV